MTHLAESSKDSAPLPERPAAVAEPPRLTPLQTIDPGPIALSMFGGNTIMLSAVNAGLVDKSAALAVVAAAFVMGGFTQWVVGIMYCFAGRVFPGVAFTSYGAFWMAFAIFNTWFSAKVPHDQHGKVVALFLFPWIIFTLIMWIGSFRANKALVVGLGLLLVVIIALTIGDWTGNKGWTKLGGWLGLILAFEVFYIAAAELINQMFKRTVLPLGSLAR